MKKLKECPFCGEENQKVSQYESGGAKVFVVQCEYCGGCQATQRVNSQLFITGITARKYVLVLSAAVRHHLEKA